MASCARCSGELHGIRKQLEKVPKSQRRPKRAYGGYLCSSCAKELHKERARIS